MFKDARVRRAFNYAFDFEEMNKQLFYGQYKRINSYFDGTDLASLGLAAGRRNSQILEDGARQGAAGSLHDALRQSGRRQSREAVRDNLREATRLLKEAGFEVRDRKLVDHDGKPVTVEIPGRRIPPSSASCCSTSRRWSARHHRLVRTVDDAQYENRLRSFDFDIITDVVGAVAVARQRAARILGLAGRRCAGLAQYHRHQESGDRRADRARSSSPRIARPGRRDQGARSRAAVELSTWCRNSPIGFARYARWDRFSHPPTAEIRPVRPAVAVVVRRRQGRAGSASGLEGSFAHGASLPPACARPRRRRAGARRGCRRRVLRRTAAPRCMAFRRSAI